MSNWNDGADPDTALPLFKWTHVAITYGPDPAAPTKYIVRVYINSFIGAEAKDKSMPVINRGPLYGSSRTAESANAVIADLRFYANEAVPQTEVQRVKTGRWNIPYAESLEQKESEKQALKKSAKSKMKAIPLMFKPIRGKVLLPATDKRIQFSGRGYSMAVSSFSLNRVVHI